MTVWQIDTAHSSANFSVKHMMVSTVRGSFELVGGTIHFDPANPAQASVEAQVSTATVNTGVKDRDAHLRSGDFFDVENYPHMSFKSTGIKLNPDNTSGILSGELTIRDVTRPVEIRVEFLGEMSSPFGDHRAGFTGETTINREDFGLNWNQILEAGGVLVSREVKISLDVQAIKVPETANA